MNAASSIFQPPEPFNIADHLLDSRIREGRGDRIAVRTDARSYSYREVQERANRFGNLLLEAGVEPEQRVLIALPDGIDFVAALFGTLKIGAVVVMVNPHLRADAVAYFYDYTRAKVALAHRETAAVFREAAAEARHLRELIVLGEPEAEARIETAGTELETFPAHPDDPAIWLFSGGTSGKPKAVVQPHASYANTTECYGKRVLGLTEDDITISVPKLFFGYAMGSNLFFPFSVGASIVLFDERCAPAVLFDKIERHRPTVLVNVPTMVHQMVAEPGASRRDLSSLRLATSAGEALPVELHDRWSKTFDVELLDGLGTAEMWHIFLSNRPGDARPGTLGRPVPGFEVKVCDDEGRELPPGQVGFLWVRGESIGHGYWQRPKRTRHAFRGEWYVSEDMISRDEEGWFRYAGRADDMLKVAGKWLSPQEVENRLLQHPAVRECAVVGVVEEDGLTRPHAYVVRDDAGPQDELAESLRAFVREALESYKAPRDFVFVDRLPRTHLGKVDRGKLRAGTVSPLRASPASH